MPALRIGLVGLDSSHCTAFTELLNNREHEFHVPGAQVVAACVGSSPDFPFGWARVPGFTQTLREQYGVAILDSPADLALACDAILLTSADGRHHLKLFRELLPYDRPIFIDKPFAVDFASAREIADLAREHNIPIFSSSALRFAQPLADALAEIGSGEVVGGDFYGPMNREITQPGLFWYGIHTVEMVYAAFGPGCARVSAASFEHHDCIVADWTDGRRAIIRGNRHGGEFGAVLHTQHSFLVVEAAKHPKPLYAGLLQQAVAMFQTGQPPVAIEETLEIIRFIEAANSSLLTGNSVNLHQGTVL